jgi:hypothetical protein
MSNAPPINVFVDLSAFLTGIDASKLAPLLDPVNIKQVYFDFVQGKAGPTFNKLLNIFAQNQDQTENPEVLGDIIFVKSGPDVGYLARSIMLMWYLGSWYDPWVLQNPPPGFVPSDGVVSADAYTQGWVWSVAQAHPMGYSNFTFGAWSSDPPTLLDFVGGTGDKK